MMRPINFTRHRNNAAAAGDLNANSELPGRRERELAQSITPDYYFPINFLPIIYSCETVNYLNLPTDPALKNFATDMKGSSPKTII
jgi:hypothetical protein